MRPRPLILIDPYGGGDDVFIGTLFCNLHPQRLQLVFAVKSAPAASCPLAASGVVSASRGMHYESSLPALAAAVAALSVSSMLSGLNCPALQPVPQKSGKL